MRGDDDDRDVPNANNCTTSQPHGLEQLAGTSHALADFLSTSGAIKLIESYNRLPPWQKFAVLDLVVTLAE